MFKVDDLLKIEVDSTLAVNDYYACVLEGDEEKIKLQVFDKEYKQVEIPNKAIFGSQDFDFGEVVHRIQLASKKEILDLLKKRKKNKIVKYYLKKLSTIGLSKERKEFADAWIAYLKDTSEENKERLHKAVENYWVGEKESGQEDWVWETKQLIKDIALNNQMAWKKIYSFIKERYHEYDYHEQILVIAKEKGIGEPVWKL